MLNEQQTKILRKIVYENIIYIICQTLSNCFMTIAQLQFIQNILIKNHRKTFSRSMNIPKLNKHCEYLLVHEKTELSVGKFENSSEFPFYNILENVSEYFTVEEFAAIVFVVV